MRTVLKVLALGVVLGIGVALGFELSIWVVTTWPTQ